MSIFVKKGVRTGMAACPTCDLGVDEDGLPLDSEAPTTYRGMDGKTRCNTCQRPVAFDATRGEHREERD